MKHIKSAFLALAGLAALTVQPAARAENMASISINPSTGEATLVPHWSLAGDLAGFHHMAQDLSLGGGANQFYSIKGTPIPAGGDIAAFTRYIAGSGAATAHADIGSKLTPDSYAALTSADPDIGYGAVNLYLIHHKSTGDYFTAIIPSSGTASAVTDLKPMSGPGGPATLGGSGYFGLTFAAANLGYGLNYFYYLRTDPVTGYTRFGTLDPALLGTSADLFDLGSGGHSALAFTGTDVGYGTDMMYYLRRDPITGFTIMGTLHPLTGKASDIVNLGSVFSPLIFVPGDVGFGTGRFYTTGELNAAWQSVSFAAIADRAISAGSFTVAPSASSTLPVALHVVPGSAGSASISGPVAGVFTITPTAPGLITLQATQAGQLAPTPFEFNMLRQSFTASGDTLLAITTQPTSQSAVLGGSASFTVGATGSTTPTYQWRKAGANITGNASATTATLDLTNVQVGDAAVYDVVVTNASGSVVSDPFLLSVTDGTPVITNSPLTAGGTVGTPFNFTITASGSPTVYTASPLPAGLSIASSTGAITGTPTTVGTTAVSLGATNATGTGQTTLTIMVSTVGVAPVIVNDPLTAGGTVGSAFNYTITASGTPTSFTATPLPTGLSLDTTTGRITGTPTTPGTTAVQLGATNASGTRSALLTITIAATGVAPVITNNPLTAVATVGAPFQFTISAAGTPVSYAASPLPAGLSVVPATGVISGTPSTAGTVSVLLGATNAHGTGSSTLTLTVSPQSPSRIVNFSARAVSGPGSQTMIVGFVVSGDDKDLLIRGIGPTLTQYGILNALADPNLRLHSAGGGIATNDDWQIDSTGQTDGTLIAQASGLVGAFPLSAGSKDSALLVNVDQGVHTAHLSPNSTTGVALMEIYDIDDNLAARLINVSARMLVSPDEGTLIAGFVISGNTPRNVLVRGVGPGLTAFGVAGVLENPQISVYRGGIELATSDDWSFDAGTAAEISTMSAAVGAFPLQAGSADAALLLTVQPGLYTVHVTGVGYTSGVALIEVYDTD